MKVCGIFCPLAPPPPSCFFWNNILVFFLVTQLMNRMLWSLIKPYIHTIKKNRFRNFSWYFLYVASFIFHLSNFLNILVSRQIWTSAFVVTKSYSTDVTFVASFYWFRYGSLSSYFQYPVLSTLFNIHVSSLKRSKDIN